MKKTWLLIIALFFGIYATSAHARTLRKGMSGQDVVQWQTFLNTRGFDVPTNGNFGPTTQRATILFQKKWKLKADGSVNSQTINKAKSLGYGSSQSSTTPSSSARTPSTNKGVHYVYYSREGGVGYLTYQVTITIYPNNKYEYREMYMLENGQFKRNVDMYIYERNGNVIYLYRNGRRYEGVFDGDNLMTDIDNVMRTYHRWRP